jgi:hypothetical protein
VRKERRGERGTLVPLEYEVIMGSVKKCDVKRGGKYIGWFDSLFF